MRKFSVRHFHKNLSECSANPNVRAQFKWPALVSLTAFNLSIITIAYHFYFLICEFPHIGRDFMNIWAAARLTLNGKMMVLFDPINLHSAQQALFSKAFLEYYLSDIPKLEIFYTWAYPPHVLPWIVGLGLLPYPQALVLWTILTFSLYAFSVAYKLPQAWWVVFILAACAASGQNVDFGYTGFLIAAFLVGGLRLLDEKPIVAGILLAFLTFKPQFAILVPLALLAGRHWRAIIAMTLTTGVLIGFSVILFGVEPWRNYFHAIVPYQTSILELIPTDTKKIRMIYMITPFITARFLGLSLSMAYGIMGLFMAAAAAAVVYVFIRPVPRDFRNAIMLTAVYLATPYAFVSDMTLLSAAVVCMLAAYGSKRLPILQLALFAVIWLLPDFVGLLNTFKVPITPFLIAGFLGLQLRWAKRPALI